MALMNCPECGRENVSDSAKKCPGCGYNVKNYCRKVNKKKVIKKFNTEEKKENKVNKVKKKNIIICFSVILFITLFFILFYFTYGIKIIKYKEAKELISEGKYERAIELFVELDDYVSAEEMKELKYLYAIQCIDREEVGIAKSILNEIGDYKESENLLLEVKYVEANKIARTNGILVALPLYQELPQDYKDVKDKIIKINEWSQYNDTFSMYYDLLDVSSSYKFTIFFDGDKIFYKMTGDGAVGTKLEIVDGEAKYSSSSMTFFVDGIILYYDGKEYTNYVRGTNANSTNVTSSTSSASFGVWVRDTIRGTTDPNADDYYEKENAATIIAEEEKEFNELADAVNAIKDPAIGMTMEEVRESTWGEPERINKTTYEWGTTEQWCYSNYRYIYFDNGRVTAISE